MVEIIWKEPPPLVSSEKASIVAELRKHPGRWALVQAGYKSTSGAAIWKKLGCEATHRRSEKQDGKSAAYDIYARWPERKTNGEGRVIQPAVTEPKPPVVRPSGGATYDPGLGRAARGVPPEGLHPASLRR